MEVSTEGAEAGPTVPVPDRRRPAGVEAELDAETVTRSVQEAAAEEAEEAPAEEAPAEGDAE